jgi:anti-sigma factor RsiW
MECRSCTESLTALLDSELTPELRAAVEAHLASCPACTEELRSLELAGTAASALPELEPSPQLWQRVVARLEHERLPAARPPAGRDRWRSLRARPWIPLTAAAGLVGGFILFNTVGPDSRRLETEFTSYIQLRELKASQNRLVLFDPSHYQRYQPERNPFTRPVESKSNPFRSASR